MNPWIAITGCNGYIGGQTVLSFKAAGYNIIGADWAMGAPWLHDSVDFMVTDDCSSALFAEAVAERNPVALIHLAGTSLVGPSIENPLPYYWNNVGTTANMLQWLNEAGWHGKVIFSSTAAVYKPSHTKLTETCDLLPSNPYGRSKLLTETVLQDAARAHGFDVTVFRYFNACGADGFGRHGQESYATHIMARIMHASLTETPFVIHGNDYETEDGTCIRDYLHVEDIAYAHRVAVESIEDVPGGRFRIYNLGTGRGTSNLEVVNMAQAVLGTKLNVEIGPRRLGDAPILVASPDKFIADTGWRPLRSIDYMLRTAYDWHMKQKKPK